MQFVVSGLPRFGKQNIARGFGQDDESIRLPHDPCFGALREPKKKTTCFPNARVSIFLGNKPADVDKNFWFSVTELSDKHRDQRGNMYSSVQDVEIIFLEKSSNETNAVKNIVRRRRQARPLVIGQDVPGDSLVGELFLFRLDLLGRPARPKIWFKG